MLTKLRQEQILQYVNERGSVTVPELRDRLDASESTIRRDITALDAEGKLTKVFGGAVRLEAEKISALEYTVEEKSSLHQQEKQMIGKFAATLIRDKGYVFIDAGTTTQAMVDYIEAKNVTYVTNAVTHAVSMAARGLKVILVGGFVKSSTQAIVGVQAVETIRKFHFMQGFFGTNGVTVEYGCTTPDSIEATVKQIAMQNCKERFVLADSSKFDQISSVTFREFDQATFITEKKVPGYDEYQNVVLAQ